jgi:hypothetical protein
MKLYIQQLAKLIGNQLGRLYRHFEANSDGAAWFLICTSLISQQKEQARYGASARLRSHLDESWAKLPQGLRPWNFPHIQTQKSRSSVSAPAKVLASPCSQLISVLQKLLRTYVSVYGKSRISARPDNHNVSQLCIVLVLKESCRCVKIPHESLHLSSKKIFITRLPQFNQSTSTPKHGFNHAPRPRRQE